MQVLFLDDVLQVFRVEERMMKIDHLVVNVNKKYQNDGRTIESIRDAGFPYMPKWGKKTAGFKVSNIWIGKEYFELVHVKKKKSDWKSDWAEMYNNGHRGLSCLILDVADIEKLHCELNGRNVAITKPEFLQFKWFFKLFTRVMPWKNCYLPFFENVSFQIGFQQMKDDAARHFMEQYMVPNAAENGIDKVSQIICYGRFTKKDFAMLATVFDERFSDDEEQAIIVLDNNQTIIFQQAKDTYIEVVTNGKTSKEVVEIENIKII